MSDIVSRPLALYIHWPFCLKKCPYCDFNSHVRASIDQEAWRAALIQELKTYATLTGYNSVSSVFFGGGTPSLMPPETVAAVLNIIRELWPVADNVEITLEANPTSVEAGRFAALAKAGVNRVSLGIQSLDNSALKFLGREHDTAQSLIALQAAREHFPRYSFDLIYAYAGQSLAQWDETLSQALSMAGGHLSLYQLTLEPQTAFSARAARGEILTVSDELAADMYLLTQNKTAQSGLPAYEISNHAASGQESRHNLAYWQYESFIGVGAGAHGRYLDHAGRCIASIGHKSPELWLQQVQQQGHGQAETTIIDTRTAQREALLMGLRMTQGINLSSWQNKFEQDLICSLSNTRLEELAQEGLIAAIDTHLRVTLAGALKLNAVLDYLLKE
jgi:putative oxygen-independent coproporphyrinogen III oxidase